MGPAPKFGHLLGSVLFAIPLVALALDCVNLPLFVNRCTTRQFPGMRALVDGRFQPLGSLSGHQVYVALDSVLDSDFLGYLKGSPNAVVIGIDHEKPQAPIWGGLTRAVLVKASNASSEQAQHLLGLGCSALRQDSLTVDGQQLLRAICGAEPVLGGVVEVELHNHSSGTKGFPVDRLYVIGIKSQRSAGEQGSPQEYVKLAFHDTMTRATHAKITNLVVPCVGVDPTDPATMRFDEYFPLVLGALANSTKPRNIYLSLYQDWPDSYRREALTRLGRAWTDICASFETKPLLIHENFRLLLVGLFLCLIVSSRFVRISLKNFIIISVSYAASFYGTASAAVSVTGISSPDGVLLVELASAVSLAVTFPLLPRWNPKGIFDAGGG